MGRPEGERERERQRQTEGEAQESRERPYLETRQFWNWGAVRTHISQPHLIHVLIVTGRWYMPGTAVGAENSTVIRTSSPSSLNEDGREVEQNSSEDFWDLDWRIWSKLV